MKLSIIIPSYNQPLYIEETLKNLVQLKEALLNDGTQAELLLFDSESGPETQAIIARYRDQLDYTEIKKDKGQYDAINKGIEKCTGDYWTWLNTDDTLDVEGIIRMARLLSSDPSIDLIYGGIDHINSAGKIIRSYKAPHLDFKTLVTHTPGIFQQGAFFRKAFTDKIGLLRNYNCSFDYEFVLRCLANGARMHVCDFKVANFRHYNVSKTGSLTPMFIREQLAISSQYGRKWYHFISFFSALRLVKHKLFPRS